MKDGALIIHKPAGMTSHDVVAITRKTLHTKKVGHTGTLDPDATGVLVLCIGQATRLVEYLTAEDKVYHATMAFGSTTDTEDASGTVLSTCALPTISETVFRDTLHTFLGKQKQIPPMYSAIKKDGQPLYQLARAGIVLEDRPARDIEIFHIEATAYTPKAAAFDVCCSKGTYIRTLCVDIAKACGSCGHMTELVRTRCGDFNLAQAVSPDTLRNSDDPESYIIDMNTLTAHLPTIAVNDVHQLTRLINGNPFDCPQVDAVPSRLHRAMHNDRVMAVGYLRNGQFHPKKVFHTEGDA